jgi:hypothetical protein
MSPRSSAVNSSGRNPVAATKAGSGRMAGESSAAIDSSSSGEYARTVRGAGWRFGPASLAGFVST